MITTHRLTKRFGKVLAVDGVDLNVHEGDVYGFLGANGSGKTTTVRMLLGLVLATSGQIELCGRPMPRSASAVLPRVGTLVEGPAAYGHLPARANLALIDASGAASGRAGRRTRRARIDGVLEQVGLAGIGNRPVKAYSLGMRQRLGLAAALLQKPDLLILDEPTNGLDPQGIHEIRDLLLGLNAAGTTVFLSSHLLAEIEQMCTRVGVLDRGRLVVQDSLNALRAPTGRTEVVTSDVAAAVALLDGRVESRDGDRLLVRAGDPAALNALLVGAGVAVRALSAERRSLEDVILERTSAGSDRVADELDEATSHAAPSVGEAAQMIRVELSKLARRPRTWLTLLLLNLLPTVVAVLLAVTDIAPRPGEGPAFLSAVLGNGSLFAVAALAIVLPLFLPLAVAVIAGDSVAGEAQAGTLRYLLVRPVGRTRLLVSKLVVVLVFTLVAVVLVAGIGFVVGRLLLGGGSAEATSALVSVSGSALTASQLVWRTLFAMGFVALSMLGVAALALLLSTVSDSPLAATLGAMAFLIGSSLLLTLDAARSLQPYLPTRYWLSFIDLFRDPILWRNVERGALLQLVYVAVFLLAAWANFATKDVKS